MAPGNARSSTIANAFFDTNILVYAVDGRDPIKNSIARGLIANQVATNEATLSVQVLQEFFNACRSKLHLNSSDAKALTEGFARDFMVVPLFEATVHDAMALTVSNHQSYWDAAILVCAQASKCPILYSEHMQHGFSWSGVTIMNPFLR